MNSDIIQNPKPKNRDLPDEIESLKNMQGKIDEQSMKKTLDDTNKSICDLNKSIKTLIEVIKGSKF